MFTSIKLSNFLSFSDEAEEIQLEPLNIIIGANGSGKSNFLEAFDLLRSAPSNILQSINDGGGVLDWLYKGNAIPSNAKIDAVVRNSVPKPKYNELRYVLEFNAVKQYFIIKDEKIVSKEPAPGNQQPYIYYDYANGSPIINVLVDEKSKYKPRKLQREDIDTTTSILKERSDSLHYPELTQLGKDFKNIRLYREWSFGRYSPARMPQKIDLPSNQLEPDCGNLYAVLNRLWNDKSAREKILKELKLFYADVEEYGVNIESSTMHLLFHERGLRSPVPATRLSDGTLRYLYLLAILCNPTLPPLICIEEPELGVHPDILPNLAKLLREASERTQLIVTTHSDILVNAFHDHPESILVAEKDENGTSLTRLNKQELAPWLKEYRLGELWSRGDIGGTRW